MVYFLKLASLPRSLALSELVLSPSSWKPMAVARYSPRESHLENTDLISQIFSMSARGEYKAKFLCFLFTPEIICKASALFSLTELMRLSPEMVFFEELLDVFGGRSSCTSLKKNSTSQQWHDGQHLG